MITTKLSSKGQVIIPKPIRTAYHWESGQDLIVIDTGEGVLLKPRTPFEETTVDDVASCLKYSGKPKTLEEMEEAIKNATLERCNGRS